MEIGLLIGFILELIGIIVIWRKMPKEVQGMDANAAAQYAEAAQKMAAMNEKLSERVTTLEITIASLREKISYLENQIDEKDQIITSWAAGIDKLINQICGYDKEPEWKPDPVVLAVNGASKPKPKARKKSVSTR